MKKYWLLLLFSLFYSLLPAQDYAYKFRLYLKDKGNTPYSIDKPEEFLSQKAVDRRHRQQIAIDDSDLPISQDYKKQIESFGVKIVAQSKWLQTISVHTTDSLIVYKLDSLPFVKRVLLVWKGKANVPAMQPDTLSTMLATDQQIVFGSYHGIGADNLHTLNGDSLHKAGYKGKGIDIAIIDAGFNHLPYISILDNVNIKGSKGFVYQNEDLFANANQHGLNVLSCMATNKPMQFVGTAPEANYWLFGSEDSRSEFPIEEDYWATAVEYADSLGIDVVNTSLGYNGFDKPTQSYTHADLDGRTAFISQAANMAGRKGMAVVCSAGNSGDSDWRKITPPSDSPLVLTVGAIRRDSVIASFSSRGLTADLRIKPDVMALGASSVVVDQRGKVTYKSGTSFSSPIMCGMVACLWQAAPTLTNKELFQVIRESANQFNDPDKDYGYGIPNMNKALQLAQKMEKQKGRNKIGGSDNYRIESDEIGQLRVVVISHNTAYPVKLTVSHKSNGKLKELIDNTFSTDTFSTKLKGHQKDVYYITLEAENGKEEFQLYF